MRAQPPTPELPEHERSLLDAAGLRDEPLTATLVIEQSKKAYDELLSLTPLPSKKSGSGSMSLEQASQALGVTPSRLRQRLGAERTLYGIKQGRDWRIPLFQFESGREGGREGKRDGKKKLVTNIDKVLPALPDGVHPLAVRSFFLLESPDLVVAGKDGDEQPVSPLAWLSAGNAPDDVIALAREL